MGVRGEQVEESWPLILVDVFSPAHDDHMRGSLQSKANVESDISMIESESYNSQWSPLLPENSLNSFPWLVDPSGSEFS